MTALHNNIKYTYGGKLLPEAYDWANDPKNYKIDNSIPKHRCFHCGYKFIGSEIVAFCNICDLAMAIGGEDMLMGFSFERRDARIRIPDDTTEEVYSKKLEDPPIKHKAEFTRADKLND